jgi:hypothetical protein
MTAQANPDQPATPVFVELTSTKSSPWLYIGFIVAALILGVASGIRYQSSRDRSAVLAAQEKAIKHAIDSVKAEYAKNESLKDEVKTEIANTNTTIIKKEREIVSVTKTIEKIPFNRLGGELKAQLERAQATPWVHDTVGVKR